MEVILLFTCIAVPTAPPTVTSYYAVDSTSLFFSWLAPPLDQQNGMVRRYDLTLTELETGSVLSYSTSGTNFTATLLHPNYQYQVEISAVTIGSGPSTVPLILLTLEDGMTSYITSLNILVIACLFLAAPSAPPGTVYITEVYSDSIGLSWSPPPLEYHNGEIIGYNITVTVVYSGEIFTVFSMANTTVISSLAPFTTYSYSVAAVTIVGIGPYSTVGTILTGEAGMHIIVVKLHASMFTYYIIIPPYNTTIAPISPPEELNVTAVTSTTVSLTWLPPPLFLRNGVIREYKINLTEVDTGRELVFYSSTTDITIPALHPSYTYFCRVSAFTVDYGPYTESFLFTTLEDGECTSD